MLLNVLSQVARFDARDLRAPLLDAAYDLPYLQLCGTMKSGTSLLRSLFDTTPDTLIYPHESELTGRYFVQLTEADQAQALDLLNGLHRYYLSHHHKNIGRPVPLTALARILARQRAMIGMTADFWTRHASFAVSFSPKRHKRWIDKSPLAFLQADFIAQRANTKFVHLVRNPADTFSSIYVKTARRGYDRETIAGLLWRYRAFSIAAFDAAVRNRARFDNYLVIRYEDLVSDPDTVMRELCRFAEIEFHPGHLKPTIAGLPWAGNNHEGLSFDRVSAHGVGAWRQRMPDDFAMVMEHGREEHLLAFSYKPSFSPHETEPAFRDFAATTAIMDRSTLLGEYDERMFADAAGSVSETAPTSSTLPILTSWAAMIPSLSSGLNS